MYGRMVMIGNFLFAYFMRHKMVINRVRKELFYILDWRYFSSSLFFCLQVFS